jgi:hypothetical protein
MEPKDDHSSALSKAVAFVGLISMAGIATPAAAEVAQVSRQIQSLRTVASAQSQLGHSLLQSALNKTQDQSLLPIGHTDHSDHSDHTDNW